MNKNHRRQTGIARGRVPALLFVALAPIFLKWGPVSAQATVAPKPTGQGAIIPSEPYQWRNVRMDGMGFVTGMVIHPTEPDLIYIRTDVGGCYRWDAKTQTWIALMDQLDKVHWPGGVESLALDAENPKLVYAAVAVDDKGEILRSPDRGTTWSALGSLDPNGKVFVGANAPYRYSGERLAVNPKNGSELYFGSRSDGLFHSVDGGQSWSRVADVPAGEPKFGVTFAQFNAAGSALYAGVAGLGVFKYDGTAWKLAQAAPVLDAYPCRAAVDAAGDCLVTYANLNGKDGGLYEIASTGAVTDITPAEAHRGYVGIAWDAKDPLKLATYCGSFGRANLQLSYDGGKTWTHPGFTYHRPGWWPDYELGMNSAFGYSGSLLLDPLHPGSAWATDGFGVFHTGHIFTPDENWNAEMHGLEEFCTLAVCSPTQGAPLLSGVADMHGFRHDNLDEVPLHTHTGGIFGDTESLDFCETHPNVVVRAGGGENDGIASNGYSTDGGETWRPFANFPTNFNNGKIAISATNPSLIVWAPESNVWDPKDPRNAVYPVRSTDGGQTWQPVTGAQRNLGAIGMWFGGTPLVADRVDGNLFYYYEQGGKLRRSQDGGATWAPTAAHLLDDYIVSLVAVPGRRGEVWACFGQGRGLYRSTDAGDSFQLVPEVSRAWQLSFGAGAPGSGVASVYVLGIIRGQYGLFRSDDFLKVPSGEVGAHWIRIDAGLGFGSAWCMAGDRQVHGRVYVGTSGRGILYGIPTGP